jgi:hypothetical protein
LAEGTPSADLTPYLPPPAARNEVIRFFKGRGFEVFLDDVALFVNISGDLSLFVEAFGVPQQSLLDIPASQTKALAAPAEVAQFVEEIVLVPEPEMLP